MNALKHSVSQLIWTWRHVRRSVAWRVAGLWRMRPATRDFGYSQGLPVDRVYIERFLGSRRDLIRGVVLEIAESTYTRKFGGDRVIRAEVLHAVDGNPQATLVGDLATGAGVPENAYDCIILTQTLGFIYNLRGVIATCHRALRPGGVVLATTGGISQISRYDMDRWGDHWRLTSLSLKTLAREIFPSESIIVETYGNLMTATALLHGVPAEQLTEAELAVHDPDYEVIIGIVARKAALATSNP